MEDAAPWRNPTSSLDPIRGKFCRTSYEVMPAGIQIEIDSLVRLDRPVHSVEHLTWIAQIPTVQNKYKKKKKKGGKLTCLFPLRVSIYYPYLLGQQGIESCTYHNISGSFLPPLYNTTPSGENLR